MISVVDLINSIRESFVGAEDVYSKGSCHHLYKILKVVYPEAKAWICDSPLHVITEINSDYFDINGKLVESFENEDGEEEWQLYCLKTGEYYDVLPMINLNEMDDCKYDIYQHLSTHDYNYKANEGGVMIDKPVDLKPVIAKIQHVNSLGLSSWFEIVFYDDMGNAWRSFSGSKTFEDGEQVVAWSYCHSVKMDNEVK